MKGERYFQSLIENALDLIALLNPEGEVIYNSPSVKRVLGYGENELIGKSAFELIHPDDLQEVTETFDRGMQTPGAMEYVKFRLRHKDGSWRSFESVGNNLLHDPAILGIVVNLRDVTDRKQVEERLKQSEGYFRALIENVLDLIAIIKPDGEFLYLNPAVERLLGYTPEELLGKSGLELIHPEDIENVLGIIDKAVQDPDFSPRVEFRALHKDGFYRYFEGIGKNYINYAVVGGIVISCRDISDRKQMEEQLYQRNEELEAFAYTVSHDLLTPAAVMEGYAKTALEADARGRPEAERECLESIIRGARRMSRLIDSLLQYARAGRIETNVEMIDSNEVLRDALMGLEETIEEKEVEVKPNGEMPHVPVDPIKLYQVFFNLIENATKHGGRSPKPCIEIGASRDGGEVLFHVKDNGAGVPPGLQKKIFEPFKHYSVAGSAGLGIGLSTVERAVTAWGGKVWVDSPPGKGATFFFTIPSTIS